MSSAHDVMSAWRLGAAASSVNKADSLQSNEGLVYMYTDAHFRAVSIQTRSLVIPSLNFPLLSECERRIRPRFTSNIKK